MIQILSEQGLMAQIKGFLHTIKLRIGSKSIEHLLNKNTITTSHHPLLKSSLPFVGLWSWWQAFFYGLWKSSQRWKSSVRSLWTVFARHKGISTLSLKKNVQYLLYCWWGDVHIMVLTVITWGLLKSTDKCFSCEICICRVPIYLSQHQCFLI